MTQLAVSDYVSWLAIKLPVVCQVSVQHTQLRLSQPTSAACHQLYNPATAGCALAPLLTILSEHLCRIMTLPSAWASRAAGMWKQTFQGEHLANGWQISYKVWSVITAVSNVMEMRMHCSHINVPMVYQ